MHASSLSTPLTRTLTYVPWPMQGPDYDPTKDEN